MDNGEENRLKQFRIHMNMTQQQMADLLKVGQNTYSRIENGVTAFKDVYKKIIEDKYHLTTGWLSGADVPMFKKYDAVEKKKKKGISGSNKEKLKEDYEIIDCKGLEIFTNVEKVKLTTYCDTYVSEYGNIKNIKVLTKLTKIKNLEISGVNNSNYDFTKLNNLERLCIKSTKLKKLNLSKNVKLKNLKLAYNPLLKKINLTKNKNLEKINLYGSGVKKITLGKNNKIKNANLNCTFISNYEKCNFNPKTLKTLKICNTQI